MDDLLRCSFGLTKTELSLLKHYLQHPGTMTVKELSERLSLERSGVQKAISTLVEKGLVERRQVNNDRGGFFYSYALVDREKIADRSARLIEAWSERAVAEVRRL